MPATTHKPAAVKHHTVDDKKKTKHVEAELPGPRLCLQCGAIVPSPVKRPARAMPEELTERQLAVLRMIAMGYTAEQIGEKLDISRRTAEFHRGALMNKLGLRSTAELTMYAIANQLIHVSSAESA